MDYEESPESSGDTSGDIDPANMEGEVNEEDVEEAEEGFGDDFDDFEAGAEGDDFGEFDEGFRESGEPQRETAKHVEPDPPSPSPFVSRFIIKNPSHQSPFTSSIADEVMEYAN